MRTRLALIAVLVALVSLSAGVADRPNPNGTVTLIWHAGDRASLFQKIGREYIEQTIRLLDLLNDVTQKPWPVRVAFFRGPDGELIELQEDKTGYT